MKKIYIRTHAYNAKGTLRRAVDSILNQTYTNFTYYLCENGSTDDGVSRQIVEEYAKSDSRIVPFYNDINRVWGGNEAYLDLPHNVDDEDYYCELDADDEYLPTFLEEMLAFMDKNDLDIACCGSQFFKVSENNRFIGNRLLENDLILEGRDFADKFPTYHVYLRTGWAKLYKGRTLRNYITRYEDFPNYPVAYGSDTFVTMRLFEDAKRVGILARPLHKYYISPNSVSYVIHPQRVKCDQILHEATVNYLQRFGEISHRNWDFLFAVYMNALKDTLIVLLKSDIPHSEKLNGLLEMFNCQFTRKLAAWENLGAFIGQAHLHQSTRNDLFMTAANWLLSLSEVSDEQVDDFCEVGEFVCAAADYANGWVFFNKLRIRWLIDQNRMDEASYRLNELEELLPYDAEVLGYRNEIEATV